MPESGWGRYSVWKGSIARSGFAFGSNGTSHNIKVPDAWREHAATTALGALLVGSEDLGWTRLIASPSLNLRWPLSNTRDSPQAPDPACPASRPARSSFLALLSGEGGVKG